MKNATPSSPMLGDPLRQARCRAKLTQQALGELLGYKGTSAMNTVQRWEYGTAPIPLHVIRRLSEVLDVPIDQFIP